MSSYGKDFDRAWRRLRTAIPTRRPVRFRLTPKDVLKRYHETNKTVFGDYDPESGLVRIAVGLSVDVAIDTLIHEYAHHVSRRKRHGKEWGAAYARCYGAVYPANK